MKHNKICSVCHSSYSYCPSCREDQKKPTWMFTFCSENCHDIYEATYAYASKKITAKEAKEKLDKLDISKYDNFGESYKKVISEINEVIKVKDKKNVAKPISSKKEESFVKDPVADISKDLDVE